MHDFIMLLVASGFGALAWLMLMVSDWLLGDNEPTRTKRAVSNANRRRVQSADLAYQYQPLGPLFRRTI